MSLVDELTRLDELHRNGALSQEEFMIAKSKLLAGDATTPTMDHFGEQMSDRLAEVAHQNEVARIDREWEFARGQFMVRGRYGQAYLPTRGTGIGTAIIGGLFGTFWTIMAFAITSSAPDVGPFPIAKVVFPLFGLLFISGAVGSGIFSSLKAADYERAFAQYKSRRMQAMRKITDQEH